MYKNCKCGNKVEIFTFCNCGEDPWNLRDEIKKAIDVLKISREKYQNKIKALDNDIQNLENALKPNK